MARGRLPRTDVGTVLLHWLIVAFLVLALATGLRIASDEPGLQWLRILDGVLPKEDIWFWHLVGALGFTASLTAYGVYILAARLGQRIRIDRSRLAGLFRAGSTRWAAAGVLLLWVVFGAFAVEITSGILLYLGHAGAALALHRNAAWICLAFPLVHVGFHLAYGGLPQLLRIFLPKRLVMPPPRPDILALLAKYIQLVDDIKREGTSDTPPEYDESEAVPKRNLHPLLMASCTFMIVDGIGVALNLSGDLMLPVPDIGQLGEAGAPSIDGEVSDAVWNSAPVVSVLTDQGANFNGTGQSLISVRAVHDAEYIYFAIVWEDPTRSLKHWPLVKDDNGWRLVRTRWESVGEDQFAEDKFSVLLSRPTLPIVGTAIHLSPRPLPDYPPSATGRGLHYTKPGGLADVWVWRADHGGMIGYLDDAHITAPTAPTSAQMSGDERYSGGFGLDSGDGCYADNFAVAPEASTVGAVTPVRLPRDIRATAADLGDIHESADISEDEGSKWWIPISDTVPYTRDADQRIPTGTILPSVLITCTPSGDRADVVGFARWSAERWSLELVRRIKTRSEHDIPISSGAMLWLAAFDHSAARHTRHIRPITLELQ